MLFLKLAVNAIPLFGSLLLLLLRPAGWASVLEMFQPLLFYTGLLEWLLPSWLGGL